MLKGLKLRVRVLVVQHTQRKACEQRDELGEFGGGAGVGGWWWGVVVQYLSPGREVAALSGRGGAGTVKLHTHRGTNNTRVATMNRDRN